jgi:arylsulfatase A-like enzyme
MHYRVLSFPLFVKTSFGRTLFLILLSLIVSLSGILQADTTRPNIILIMTDDMGYGDVGFNGMRINGQSTTPNLDQLAAAGIKFTRFYAGGPVCSPTRATCMTGRHYCRHGIWEANIGELSEHEITSP